MIATATITKPMIFSWTGVCYGFGLLIGSIMPNGGVIAGSIILIVSIIALIVTTGNYMRDNK